MKPRQWTDDEIKTLKRLYPTTRPERLSEIMSRSRRSIYMKAFDLGLPKCASYLAKRENSGRFTSENRPEGVPIKTTPAPIGSLRLNSDGTYIIKFTDEHQHAESWRNWKTLLRHIWEQSGRTVPANHFVTFKEGRKTTNPHDINIDMLECVTMSQFVSRRNATPKEILLLQRDMREILMEVQKSSRPRSGEIK